MTIALKTFLNGIPVTNPYASPKSNVISFLLTLVFWAALIWFIVNRKRKRKNITIRQEQTENLISPTIIPNPNRGLGWFTLAVFVTAIFGSIIFYNKSINNGDGTPQVLASMSASASAAAANWFPEGYEVDSALNSTVAYHYQSHQEEAGKGCIWCSAKHGFTYWKVNFIAKNGCSNLFINSEIQSANGTAIGSWYQKGGAVSAMQPEELEIVAHNATDTFMLTQISCT